MDAYSNLVQLLDDQQIAFEIINHDPVYTMEDAISLTQSREEENLKTILLESKENYYLFVTSGYRKVPVKDLKLFLKEKKLQFANEHTFNEVLGYEVGAATPIGNSATILIIVDHVIKETSHVYINPARNDITFRIKTVDFFKVLDENYKYIMLN